MLLIAALFTSYMLQTRKIEAVHETVVSIFAGMFILGLTTLDIPANTWFGRDGSGPHPAIDSSSFSTRSSQLRLSVLLQLAPAADYFSVRIRVAPGMSTPKTSESQRLTFTTQGNFFHNLGSILTFAFAGTFISALVLGLILFLWAWIPLEGLNLTFVEAMSVGATLSATDPVTVLAIFNTYKVDPKLYTVIFGESILNDAIAIVLFETAQKYKQSTAGKTLNLLTIFESIGLFLGVFFGSLVIGIVVGIATSLLLKFTLVRRYSKIESCLVILIAYATYFLSNAIHMSGMYAQGRLPSRHYANIW
jgi:solute carrier family 9 (sodium/hydrogen exchanger), member 6/7